MFYSRLKTSLQQDGPAVQVSTQTECQSLLMNAITLHVTILSSD